MQTNKLCLTVHGTAMTLERYPVSPLWIRNRTPSPGSRSNREWSLQLIAFRFTDEFMEDKNKACKLQPQVRRYIIIHTNEGKFACLSIEICHPTRNTGRGVVTWWN